MYIRVPITKVDIPTRCFESENNIISSHQVLVSPTTVSQAAFANLPHRQPTYGTVLPIS
jgi:hypothetical protein